MHLDFVLASRGRRKRLAFNTIYKGSVVRYEVIGLRAIAPGSGSAREEHAQRTDGPLAGEHNSLFTMVLVQQQNDWRIAAFHNTLVT